jgi:hypothetical protein
MTKAEVLNALVNDDVMADNAEVIVIVEEGSNAYRIRLTRYDSDVAWFYAERS